MKKLQSKLLAAFLIPFLAIMGSAQQVIPLSKKAAAVKRKVDTLSLNAPISVIPINGGEGFGNFVSRDAEKFTFYDVDRKVDVTFRYDNIRKIKDGYGGYNSVQRRHTDRTKVIIVVIAVAGALGALIGAAASAKN
jgi:hypothetical protein